MIAHRLRATDGTALARALDYSLKRWIALTRYIDDGQLPIDNNWVKNQIRPIALHQRFSSTSSAESCWGDPRLMTRPGSNALFSILPLQFT